MTTTDPRVLAELDGEQRTDQQTAPAVSHYSDCALNNGPALQPGECDCGGIPAGQTPPAGPDPEVVERMADVIDRQAEIYIKYLYPSVTNADELARLALATIRPGDALGNDLVAVRVDGGPAAGVEFKRDAAPDPDDKPPFRVIDANPPRIVGRGALYLREEPDTTYQFLCIAANERPAMLAEIDRLRTAIDAAVKAEREACARFLEDMAEGERSKAYVIGRERGDGAFPDKPTLLMARKFDEAAAAIRARVA